MTHRFSFQIDRFLEQLASARRATATIAGYRRILHSFEKYAKEQGTEDDLRAVSGLLIACYRQQILSKTTHSMDWKIRSLSFVKIFFAWLLTEGLILKNPTANCALPKMRGRRLPPYLCQQEVKALIAAAAELRDRAILETLYSTGMRASECYRLQLADINFADGLVRINCGKGSKDRMVPIGARALQAIETYLSQEHRSAGPLFRKLIATRAIDSYDLRVILARCSRKAGLQMKIYPHLLRHSFAAHLLENGADIRYIQQMLGHENLTATQIYTRVVPVALKKAHAAAHPAEKRPMQQAIRISGYYKNTGQRSSKVLSLAAKRRKALCKTEKVEVTSRKADFQSSVALEAHLHESGRVVVQKA